MYSEKYILKNRALCGANKEETDHMLTTADQKWCIALSLEPTPKNIGTKMMWLQLLNIIIGAKLLQI